MINLEIVHNLLSISYRQHRVNCVSGYVDQFNSIKYKILPTLGRIVHVCHKQSNSGKILSPVNQYVNQSNTVARMSINPTFYIKSRESCTVY